VADLRTHFEHLARRLDTIRESDDDSLPLCVWPDTADLDSPRAVHHFLAEEMLDRGLIDADVDDHEIRIHGLTKSGQALLS
jgi:hypothetical protein